MKNFFITHKNGIITFLILGAILSPVIIVRVLIVLCGEANPNYELLFAFVFMIFWIVLFWWTCLKNYIVLRFILRKHERMHFGRKLLIWNALSLITGYALIVLLTVNLYGYVPWYDVTNALSWAKPVIRMLGLIWMFLFGAAASYLFVLRKTEFSLIRKILYSLISALSSLPVALMLGV